MSIEKENGEQDEKFQRAVAVTRNFVNTQIERSGIESFIVANTYRGWADIYSKTTHGDKKAQERYYELVTNPHFNDMIMGAFFTDFSNEIGVDSFLAASLESRKKISSSMSKAFTVVALEFHPERHEK